MDLRQTFLKEMFNVYKRAKKEVGYNATGFLKLLSSSNNGVTVAKQLIHSSIPSSGFIELWKANRLDLTVEYLLLKKDYFSLFTEEERNISKERLKEYGFQLLPQTLKENNTNSISKENKDDINDVFPDLQPKERDREYKTYQKSIRDKVVYEYLFNGKSHRWLDDNVIGLNSKDSKGYQSMGILHFIGLRDIHKGIFKTMDIHYAVAILRNQGTHFDIVTQSLERYSGFKDFEEQIFEEDSSSEYLEGKEAFRIHKFRERNSTLIKQAKVQFLKKHGFLYCQACGINFEDIYGERGRNYIEAHHIKPISEMNKEEKTKIEDLAMLCSNCHRMIHKKPFISVEDLKSIIEIHSKKVRS